MNRLSLTIVPLLALAACSATHAEFVLLGTGALLEGKIERGADRIVLRGPGSEMILRPAEVLCVAESSLEVYEWIRRERVTDLEGRLSLANWAIKNKLWPQAARELLDARQMDPRDPRLAILERRLDELSAAPPEPQPLPERAVTAAQAPAAQAPAPVVQTVVTKPLPGLPPGALEHFTRKIQPLLRNGCASCHRGDAADPLGLDSQWVRGHASARSTQRNLHAVLEQIDLASPKTSSLLTAARGPHHGTTPFRGPRRDELIARLEAWVLGLAAANPQGEASLAAYEAKPMPTDSAEQTDAVIDPAVKPASYEAPAPKANPKAGDEEPYDFDAPYVRPKSAPQRGVQLKRVGPRDEFDPAIFNERFRRPEDREAVGG